MATTRKTRARTEKGQFQGDDSSTPQVNEAWVSTADLAAFIGFEGDQVKLGKAIQLATDVIQKQLGKELPEQLSHELAQAVRLTATKLLMTDQLDEPVKPEELPAVVRYFLRLAGAEG
jgi:hypothetical protein